MVLLTSILATVVVLYVITSGWDNRGRHFHALFQFQLMGINGAFLTGDVFNLFVFFEVLLIASYGLMLHGGGTARLQAGVQYVVINLAGSTLLDRKSVVEGKSVSVRVDLGGRRNIKKKTNSRDYVVNNTK